MARMYSRRKGKAGKRRPLKKTIPSWVRYKGSEVELLVTRLAREGHTASGIGLILRDVYGIPDIKLMTKKSVTKIMDEKKLGKELPEDILALIRKSVFLRKHIEANKHDQTAKRGLTLADSKIKRLTKYYKRTGKIASEWKYDAERASMYVS